MAKKSKIDLPNFIVYSGDHEAIITTPKKENKTIKHYFTDGGRDLGDYDRDEIYSDEVWVGIRGIIVG